MDLTYSDKLDIFSSKSLDNTIEYTEIINFRPVTPLRKDSVIEFNINSLSSYIDLSQTKICMKVRLLKSDGNAIGKEDNVTLINYPVASIIKNCTGTLNGVDISSGIGNLYSYNSLFKLLLDNNEDIKESLFQAGGFYKDVYGYENSTDPKLGGNIGLTARYNETQNGKIYDLIGPVFLDMFTIDKYLIHGVNLSLNIYPNSDAFVLLSDQNNYKFEIVDCYLKMTVIKVSPDILISHNTVLNTANAKYDYKKSMLKAFTVPPNMTSFSQDNIFLGKVPNEVIIAIVRNKAFNGSFQYNPFAFENFNVCNVNLQISGQNEVSLKPNYDSNHYMECYDSMFNEKTKVIGNYISREDYKNGCAIYMLTVKHVKDPKYVYMLRNGYVRLNIDFKQPVSDALTVIVYTNIDALVEFDDARNVYVREY